MTLKKVYIAGQVTGIKGYRDRFERAEDLLLSEGYQPVNPTAAGEVDGYTYRDYINRGLRLLEECDAICMLPGWTGSRGAKLEKWYAETVQLPILFVDPKYESIRGPLL